MLKRTGIFFVLILGLMLPVRSFGQEAPPGKWWRIPAIAEQLKLTGEEKRQLDALFLENRRELIRLKGLLETEQLDLENLLDQEPMNETAVMAQFRKLQEARTRLGIESFSFILKVRKILGVERFQRLKLIREKIGRDRPPGPRPRRFR